MYDVYATCELCHKNNMQHSDALYQHTDSVNRINE